MSSPSLPSDTATTVRAPVAVGAPPPPRRAPLVPRKQSARREARRRIAARTRTPLTREQLALDPLVSRRTKMVSLAIIGAAFLGSIVLHVAGVGSSFLLGKLDRHERQIIDQPVKIEVREPPPPPPPVVEEPPKEETVAAPEPPKPQPKPKVKLAKALPPPEAKTPPPPEAKEPPPRVIGLSLESTSDGDGPSFAVGNTREGTTGKRAADPKNVVAGATGPVVEQPSTPNQVASRIPVSGVSRVNPKKKEPELKPPYPPLLKAQGIEADVALVATIDADGKVTKVRVTKPSPYPEMNDAAVATARRQLWEPGRLNGVPVVESVPYTYRFRLED